MLGILVLLMPLAVRLPSGPASVWGITLGALGIGFALRQGWRHPPGMA